jgi:methyl-accepting chemotaxis protein
LISLKLYVIQIACLGAAKCSVIFLTSSLPIMSLKNARIGTRLGFAFATLMLALISIIALAIFQMSAVQGRLKEIVDINVAQATLAAEMRANVLTRAIAVRNVVLVTDEAEMNTERQRIAKLTQDYTTKEEQLIKLYAGAKITETETELLKKIKDHEVQATPIIDKVVELGLKNDISRSTGALVGELRPVQGKWIELLDKFIDFQNSLNEQAVLAANAAYDQALKAMLALGIMAAFIGVLSGWWTTRSITRPLDEAVRVAQRVANGDLTSSIEATAKDETGLLLNALKDMNGALVKIVSNVRSGTEAMSSASRQIATGNAELSHRTEEQASSLEETASSMEELTGTVKQNADNSQQASDLAATASSVASRGGQVVGEVVDTMMSINESSKKIVDIIAVIDGIAFQTNILALNAAVEAARAGEQGRGFAVVASEVRSLAQRSAAAAKEVKDLITDSVTKVENGTRLVDEAGKTMDEIVSSVQGVTDIMKEIAAASREQSSGIEQVNQAVTQMDEVTQQNAALVEESAAAAESLLEQAQDLAATVAAFKLADGATASPSAVGPRKLAPVADPAANANDFSRKSALRRVLAS